MYCIFSNLDDAVDRPINAFEKHILQFHMYHSRSSNQIEGPVIIIINESIEQCKRLTCVFARVKKHHGHIIKNVLQIIQEFCDAALSPVYHWGNYNYNKKKQKARQPTFE